MRTRVHYPAELKWKAINMKLDGYSNREIMNQLGIKNEAQIKRWMRWYKNGESHVFTSP